MKKYSQLLVAVNADATGETRMTKIGKELVDAEIAIEMLKVLKSLIRWDEIDQHSDDDMIAVAKFESIINNAKSIITKAEEV